MKLTAESTVINDEALNSNITTAQQTAETATSIATNTAQHFWFKSTGTDTGAHISEKTQAEFESSPSGGNLLANSNGIAVRSGLQELARFGATGMEIFKDSGTRLLTSGATASSQNIKLTKYLNTTLAALTGEITVPELANAKAGTTITLYVQRRNIDTGGYTQIVSDTATKGTSKSMSYALYYDGANTFSNGNTDYDIIIKRISYYVAGPAGQLAIGSNALGSNAISVNDAFTVDFSGNVVASGTLKCASIGETNANGTSGTAKTSATASGSWVSIDSFVLEAGVYIITAAIQFASNATGRRAANISATDGSNWSYINQTAVNGVATCLNPVIIVNPSSQTRYYINGYQNSGTTLSVTTEYYYVRIA